MNLQNASYVGVYNTIPAGTNNVGGGCSLVGTATATSDTPEAAPSTVTVTISAAQTKSWRNTYGWRTDNNRVYQGEWETNGNHKGCIRYDSSNLSQFSGKTISSIKLTVKRYNGGGSSSSGTGYLYYHNYTSFPSGEPSGTYLGTVTIPAWGQTTTWDLSSFSALKSAISNGTFKGFMLYSSSGSLTAY